MYRKLMVVGIIFILCSSIVSGISGYDEERNQLHRLLDILIR